MSMGLFAAALNDSTYNKAQHIQQLKMIQKHQPKIYWVAMAKNDFLYASALKLRALYDEIGFKYTYRENEGTHDWNSWRLYLSEFAQLIFK
jgi:enterochelin esterase-like enzyme